jgi:CcmD family protein
MRKIKQLLSVALLLVFSTVTNAQGGSNESPVGEFMRSNERSYVVIAVMATILLGLFIYIIRLDRKISKLEKEK